MKFTKPINREVEIDGHEFVVSFDDRGIEFRLKGKRKTARVDWPQVIDIARGEDGENARALLGLGAGAAKQSDDQETARAQNEDAMARTINPPAPQSQPDGSPQAPTLASDLADMTDAVVPAGSSESAPAAQSSESSQTAPASESAQAASSSEPLPATPTSEPLGEPSSSTGHAANTTGSATNQPTSHMADTTTGSATDQDDEQHRANSASPTGSES